MTHSWAKDTPSTLTSAASNVHRAVGSKHRTTGWIMGY